jgi:hypothetical protein
MGRAGGGGYTLSRAWIYFTCAATESRSSVGREAGERPARPGPDTRDIVEGILVDYVEVKNLPSLDVEVGGVEVTASEEVDLVAGRLFCEPMRWDASLVGTSQC